MEDILNNKFGTYVRSEKYEAETKIERRILFFIRNYEYDNNTLANEISKEFDLTLDQAMIEIISTRTKYPNVKKSRKILERIPKP